MARVLPVVMMVLLAGCFSPEEQQQPEPAEPESLGRNADASPEPGWHRHDLFGDQSSLILMDEAVVVTVAHNHLFDSPPRDQHTHGCDEDLASSSQGGSVKFSLPSGTIVPPGTRQLEFTVDWSDPAITGVRLFYRPPAHDHGPGQHEHMGHDGYMDAGQLAQGASVAVPITEAMTDVGHQFHSNWAFFLCADGGELIHVAQGAIEFQAIAHKGMEPNLDPPHPDHWGNESRLPVASHKWSGRATALANQGDAWFHLEPTPGATIPWGTLHVAVQVNASTDLATQWTLFYRDAASVEWLYRQVQPEPGGAESMTFIIGIDTDGEGADVLDSPYANRSHWDFWLRGASPVSSDLALVGPTSAPHSFQGEMTAFAYASRDPVPA